MGMERRLRTRYSHSCSCWPLWTCSVLTDSCSLPGQPTLELSMRMCLSARGGRVTTLVSTALASLMTLHRFALASLFVVVLALVAPAVQADQETFVQGACSDGVCAPGENCISCSSDCGPCAPTCGNSACKNGVRSIFSRESRAPVDFGDFQTRR